jgi:hypothetical protein
MSELLQKTEPSSLIPLRASAPFGNIATRYIGTNETQFVVTLKHH